MQAPFYPTGAFGPGASLWAALALGTAFGFVLERAGFGSSRKLAAQFYLTDLTVFKVMFSAIATAALGLVILAQVGSLDLSLVYVPDTFLLPQVVGGLFFGVGFVAGGLCPGTSCVAAATGRGDGVALLLGMAAGILLFGEVFPAVAGFYGATPLGPLTLPQLLHLPRGAVTLAVVGLAAAGCATATRIERRATA